MDQIDRDLLEAHTDHMRQAFAAEFAYVLVMKDDNEMMALISGEPNIGALISALVRAIVVHKDPDIPVEKFIVDTSFFLIDMMTTILSEPDMTIVKEES